MYNAYVSLGLLHYSGMNIARDLCNFLCFIVCHLYDFILPFQDWSQDEKQNLVPYSIIFVSVTFNIFIFCYIGEMLAEQVTILRRLIINITYLVFTFFIYLSEKIS